MVIDRSKHNKFVGLPEKTTDTGGTTGASGSGSGDGSTTVIIGGGGGTASLDPELIEELRNQEAFSYINISDGQNTILTSAQIEKDYFNLAIQGDGETSETQVSSDKYLPRTQIEATGSIPGSYWVVFNHVQVPDEGPDGEPVYKDIWRIELTKMSPDPAVRPNIDYNGIELIYQGVSQGVYSLSDNRVSVQPTADGDTLTITINQDNYIDFDTLQLVWTQDANHTPVTTLSGIAVQNYVTVTITQAGATRFWKLDEYGDLYTDHNAYSNLDLGAKGRLWTDTGLYVGNFTQGISGGVFYVQNEQGDTYIEADRMRIRKKAYFETLEIVNVNSVGGKQIISPAGAITVRKVEETTLTDDDGTETPVYRCYFMGEQDGVEVENRWHIGDQAFSQNFNIRTPGEYEQVANHYFWRLVVGLSTELDDDGNYYIDLSVNDCDQDSDPPHVNDVVAQLGNRNEVDRQSALIFSSVDAESPRIILCHGIDSYTLANTEYFDVGVDHAENRAYMNVYGDTYIGDRNNIDESKGYVYYDSSTQTLNIRASISASSTIGDKKFSEVFVTAENFENMTNAVLGPQLEYIQNQIDGTVEAYFYDYSPTLENEPAFTWREEGKQNEHLGDTFTNIQTYISDEETPDAGKSWRWVLKDGVYGWEPIADSDAVAALKKAAEAQDTADGKRRVFVTQPTQEQAYDIGDLWVNATYSDGSVTYNDDILRANTAKQAGYPFSISHWGQASAYRDLYDQALQKAQAAADAAGDVQTAVDRFKTDIEETFQDGVITTSEASRLRTLIDTINTTVYNAKQTFNDIYNNSHLEGTTEKSNLLIAYNAFIADTDDDPNTITPRIVNIIEQLLAKVDNTQAPYQITKGDISSINQEYATFNDNYEDYIVALNAANLKITSQIANTAEASAVARYAYLENLFSGKTTIEGAVITTGMMVVGTENSATGEYTVNGGFSGVDNSNNSIAIWYGGDKIDAETSSDHNDRIAGSLLRYDGSGYFGAKWVQDSKGNWNVEYGIRWDKDGVVTVDPATFWVGEEKIDLLLQVFNAIDSEPSDGVTDEVIMRVPFREVLIGSAYIGYDAANNSVYVYKQNQDGTREACNFYATGEVTAYGSSYEDESPEYARYVRDLRDVNYGGNVDPENADTLLMWNGTTWAFTPKTEVGFQPVTTDLKINDVLIWNGNDWTNLPMSSITPDMSGYVTTNTEQTITAKKNFENNIVLKTKSILFINDSTSNYTGIEWRDRTGDNSYLGGVGLYTSDGTVNGVNWLGLSATSGVNPWEGDVRIYPDGYIKILNAQPGIILDRPSGNPYIRYTGNNQTYGELGVTPAGLLVYWPAVSSAPGYGKWNQVLYKSNYSTVLDDRYVINSGDTMTGNYILAGTESNHIENVFNNNSSITVNSPASLSAIRHAISFKWYDTDWQIGNIRGGSSDSKGFGITKGNSQLVFSVSDATCNIYEQLNVHGRQNIYNSILSINSAGEMFSIVIDNNNATETSMSIYRKGIQKGVVGYNDTYGTFLWNHDSGSYIGLRDDGVPRLNNYVMWHEGNDGSGSGLDADLLDGYHRSNLYTSIQDWLYATENGEVTITINGDANTYYPVVINCGNNSKLIYSQVSIYRDLWEQCASYPGNHSSGTSSMWLVYDYRYTAWDGNGGFIRTMLYSMQYASLCAHTDTDGKNSGSLIVYLRGGGTVYHIASTGGVARANIYYSTTNIGTSQYPYNVSPLTSLGNAGVYNTGSYHLCTDLDGNAASATRLRTPRAIWGQSFDGTADVSGQLSGCTRITNSTSQPLYLGNADNSSWVYTQDIASHNGVAAWALKVDGRGWLQKLNVGYTYSNEGSFPLNVQGTVSSTSLSTQNIRIECDNSGALSGRGNEINNYNSHLYLQHNTTTNLICCMGGGNMGIGTNPSYKLHVNGDIKSTSIYTDSWFRSNGNTGWYSETYSGGIYMEDTTWVRVYNNKGLYVTGTIFTNGYNNHGNNYGYIVINKLGDYYAAIGGNGAIDEIKFGKSGVDGAWVTGNINWRFEGNILATGEVTAYGSSDIRLKTNIQPLRALDTVRKMNVVEYDWNEKALSLRNSNTAHGYGLIAQELEELIPEVVTHDMYGKGYMGIDYRNLVPFALSAIQQVDDEVTALKKRVKELEDKLSKYEHV